MAKKRIKHKITLKEALDRIPHDPDYCNDSGRCPYFRIRNLTRTKMIRIAKSKEWFGIPSWYFKRNQLEYCVFLKDWLYIQDRCKDCGINEYDETGGYGEDYLEQKRLKNREFADFYKKKFPEEADLIDKIVEEDKLEYWYKKEEKHK